MHEIQFTYSAIYNFERFNISTDLNLESDTSVKILIRLRAGRQTFDCRQRQKSIFFFATASRPALGPTQPSIHWALWTLSSEVNRQGREADGSLPTS
jgi:hypothetical protein